MGTSNWQNISWCVQAIMQIEPERVLDIGVGFGRWGMILREFGEVWFGRVSPDDWRIHIEGIEAYAPNLASYHDHFYDKIHQCDVLDILFEMEEHWNLVILGDVLEHFVKSDGERILDRVIEKSDYVIVNLPLGDEWPQEDMYGNPYEEHKAVWDLEDFERRPVVSQRRFFDFEVRPFAGVVLSRDDPKHLARGLFGSPRQGEELESFDSRPEADVSPLDATLLRAVQERIGAVDSIRKSSTWKLLNQIRNNSMLWRTSALLSGGKGSPITLQHEGVKADGSPCKKLRVLRVEHDGSPTLWDFLRRSRNWKSLPREDAAFGECLETEEAGAALHWFGYNARVKIHLAAGPDAGICSVGRGRESHRLDLQQPVECQAVFDCARGELVFVGQDGRRKVQTTQALLDSVELADLEEATLDNLRASETSSLAVYVPEWVGILRSTQNLFEVTHPLAHELDAEARERFLRMLEEARPENLIFSGGAIDHLRLCQDIKKRSPDTRIKLLWHGNFMQVSEETAWRGLRSAIELSRKGVIHTLGFVKEGMEEFFDHLGIASAFVMNYVPRIPQGPSKPAEGGPHIGLWISNQGWRKLPHAMAAATRRAGGILHIAGQNQRLEEFCRLIELNLHKHGGPLLAPDELDRWMTRMHLNLYVTLSECCPMLPLESLAVGTPCLLGPTSHLFRDHEYLYDRLVVRFPDSSSDIYSMIQAASAERDEIIAAYAEYAVGYNERARTSLSSFLER